jgi:hypothetical protein
MQYLQSSSAEWRKGIFCKIYLLAIKSMKLLKPFHTPPIMRLTTCTIHNHTSATVAVSRPRVSFVGPCSFKNALCKSEDIASSGRFVSEK